MTDIVAERCPGGVKITTTVGAKKASISITGKKARQLAASIMMLALESRSAETGEELMNKVVDILRKK